MEEGQQADNGEATAGALLGGLTKRFLQDRGIRHGAARAVDKKRPMAMPAAFLGDGGLGRPPQALQEVFEHTDGELGAGLTVGGGTEIETGEMGEMATGRIAMEDLQQKQLHRDHRIEEAVTPCGVAYCCTGGADRLGLQLGSPICFEALEDSRDTGYHRGSPRKNSGGASILPEESRVCQSS